MKILKYVGIGIAILVIGFLVIGFIQPTVDYDCEVMVQKSAEEAWAVSQDEEKMPEWLPGYQKTEPISGTPGTVGAVSDIYFENDGEQMVIRETITEIVPNESISMNFTSGFMDMDYTLRMAPEGGGTKISSTTSAKGNGMMSKSFMAMIAGSIEAQEETNLANLKKIIEENTKNYFEAEEVMTDEPSIEIVEPEDE